MISNFETALISKILKEDLIAHSSMRWGYQL